MPPTDKTKTRKHHVHLKGNIDLRMGKGIWSSLVHASGHRELITWTNADRLSIGTSVIFVWNTNNFYKSNALENCVFMLSVILFKYLSYYHHQIGSIHLSHCCHIFPWLCVWDGCTIIFCHLLHIYPGNTGTLFPLLMFSLWYLQMIGYIMACRSCSFVCRLHHLIIIIMQTYLKALNY